MMRRRQRYPSSSDSDDSYSELNESSTSDSNEDSDDARISIFDDIVRQSMELKRRKQQSNVSRYHTSRNHVVHVSSNKDINKYPSSRKAYANNQKIPSNISLTKHTRIDRHHRNNTRFSEYEHNKSISHGDILKSNNAINKYSSRKGCTNNQKMHSNISMLKQNRIDSNYMKDNKFSESEHKKPETRDNIVHLASKYKPSKSEIRSNHKQVIRNKSNICEYPIKIIDKGKSLINTSQLKSLNSSLKKLPSSNQSKHTQIQMRPANINQIFDHPNTDSVHKFKHNPANLEQLRIGQTKSHYISPKVDFNNTKYNTRQSPNLCLPRVDRDIVVAPIIINTKTKAQDVNFGAGEKINMPKISKSKEKLIRNITDKLFRRKTKLLQKCVPEHEYLGSEFLKLNSYVPPESSKTGSSILKTERFNSKYDGDKNDNLSNLSTLKFESPSDKPPQVEIAKLSEHPNQQIVNEKCETMAGINTSVTFVKNEKYLENPMNTKKEICTSKVRSEITPNLNTNNVPTDLTSLFKINHDKPSNPSTQNKQIIRKKYKIDTKQSSENSFNPFNDKSNPKLNNKSRLIYEQCKELVSFRDIIRTREVPKIKHKKFEINIGNVDNSKGMMYGHSNNKTEINKLTPIQELDNKSSIINQEICLNIPKHEVIQEGVSDASEEIISKHDVRNDNIPSINDISNPHKINANVEQRPSPNSDTHTEEAKESDDLGLNNEIESKTLLIHDECVDDIGSEKIDSDSAIIKTISENDADSMSVSREQIEEMELYYSSHNNPVIGSTSECGSCNHSVFSDNGIEVFTSLAEDERRDFGFNSAYDKLSGQKKARGSAYSGLEFDKEFNVKNPWKLNSTPKSSSGPSTNPGKTSSDTSYEEQLCSAIHQQTLLSNSRDTKISESQAKDLQSQPNAFNARISRRLDSDGNYVQSERDELVRAYETHGKTVATCPETEYYKEISERWSAFGEEELRGYMDRARLDQQRRKGQLDNGYIRALRESNKVRPQNKGIYDN